MILRHAHCNHDTTGIHSAREKTACTTAERSGCKPYGCNSLYRFRICKDLSIENWDDFIKELPDDEIVIPETYN